MNKTAELSKTPVHRKNGGLSKRLLQLARKQKVKPLPNATAIESLWPSEFDPDIFLDYLGKTRAQRRLKVRRGNRE